MLRFHPFSAEGDPSWIDAVISRGSDVQGWHPLWYGFPSVGGISRAGAPASIRRSPLASDPISWALGRSSVHHCSRETRHRHPLITHRLKRKELRSSIILLRAAKESQPRDSSFREAFTPCANSARIVVAMAQGRVHEMSGMRVLQTGPARCPRQCSPTGVTQSSHSAAHCPGNVRSWH